MAKGSQVEKRKAVTSDDEIEQAVHRTEIEVAEAMKVLAKKRKATDDAAPAKVKKTKTPKVSKSATNDDDATPTESKPTESRVSGRVKKPVIKDLPTNEMKPKKSALKSSKATKASKPSAFKAGTDNSEEEESGAESEADDQTIALLKGFESEGDDEEHENKEGLPEGQEVGERKQLSKSQEKKLKAINEAAASDKPGVVYVGRIPHGFFENEMKAYFSQFGTILKLRLSRNKKTGASKHHAWIQFESAEVADIVAKTMDNYLMFGHLLKVKMVPSEQLPKDLFKGANKRFKKVPWNKLVGRKLAQGASEEVWHGRVEREEQRREKKADKLKAIGYEFEAPSVKSAKGVAKKVVEAAQSLIEAPVEAVKSLIEAPADETASVTEKAAKPKKKAGKKAKAAVDEDVDMNGAEDPAEEFIKTTKKINRKAAIVPSIDDAAATSDAVIVETVTTVTKKGKKAKADKKRKSDDFEVQATEEPADATEKTKAKKPKKAKGEKA